MQKARSTDTLVTIGKILKPHGIRGIVKILATTDEPERFRLLERINIRYPGTGKLENYTIEQINVQSTGVLIKFAGINNRTEAEYLRGCELIIDENDCLPLAAGAYYCFQLEGLQVVDLNDKHLGEIIQVLQYPAHDVYVMRYGTAEVMIPAVSEFIKAIDIETGKMILSPVEGLLPEEK